VTTSNLARAASELRPLEQGDLDGLCGLYAVINVLRVATYPGHLISNRMAAQLLDCGLRLLGRKRKLRQVIVYGIDHELWLSMCLAVATQNDDGLNARSSAFPTHTGVRR
jgi:hypothetical protein